MIFDSIAESDSATSTHSTRLDISSTRTSQQSKQQHCLLPIPTSQSTTSSSQFSTISMPNLPLSVSLESFIRECARGSSSTPKKSAQISLGFTGEESVIIPTPKSTSTIDKTTIINGEMFDMNISDCGLTRVSICKNMPDIEVDPLENEVNFKIN